MGSTPTPGFLREYSEFSEVFGVAWSLNRQGYSEETVKFTVKLLKGLARACCLDDPESVKAYVAEASALIEKGFDYVCDVEDAKLFRKPKC